MAAITTTFVRIIDSTEIAQLGEVTLSFNIGQSGASAYQSYLATTTEDPKKSEEVWAASFEQIQSDWNKTDNAAKDFIKNKPTIPTATSDLTNDSDFVSDADYVHTDNNYTDNDVLEVAKIVDKANSSDVNTALGNKADLVNGLVSSSQLPSYVDDVIEVANFAALPLVGESGKIYITQDDNLTYRWSGTGYAEVSKSLALGETSATAYRGDRGKTAYDHSQITGNPHGTTAEQVGAVPEVSDTDTTLADTDEILKKDTAGLWKKVSATNFKTWLGLTFAKISDYFNKTESDRRFVNQNGGTIYHITRWFTPTSALQIAANGLSATIISGQFTAAMTGAKLRLTSGVNEPIITFVNSNNITLSFAVDASFFSQSVAVADWGVYQKYIAEQQYGLYVYNFNKGGDERTDINGDSIGTQFHIKVGSYGRLGYDGLELRNDMKMLFSSNTSYVGTKDTGLFRPSTGLLQIYDGITTTALRDLKLRSLFADKIILNALNTAPSSATDTGTLGEVRITSDYIYVCTATNTWKRTLIETW